MAKRKAKGLNKAGRRKKALNSDARFNLTPLFWKQEFTQKGCKTREDFLRIKNQKIAEYVGDQTKYINKVSSKSCVYYCNITGQMCTVHKSTNERLLKEYGTREGVQKHFVCHRMRLMEERYGRAWLYLQVTPRFKELRRKLRLLMYAYNTNTERTREDFDKIFKKMKSLTRPEGIPVLKPILHKKTDNHIDGVWLKGIPFIYSIFITSEATPPNWVEVESEDIAEDRDDDNPPEKEYTLDDVPEL